jgi:hypothetical protein
MKPWHVAAAFAAALLLPFLILFGIIVGILGSPARVCGAASPASAGGAPRRSPRTRWGCRRWPGTAGTS